MGAGKNILFRAEWDPVVFFHPVGWQFTLFGRKNEDRSSVISFGVAGKPQIASAVNTDVIGDVALVYTFKGSNLSGLMFVLSHFLE